MIRGLEVGDIHLYHCHVQHRICMLIGPTIMAIMKNLKFFLTIVSLTFVTIDCQ